MGRKRSRGRRGVGVARPKAGRNMEPAKKENASFEKYYKAQGIIPEGDWDTFMASLRSPLPATFRINSALYDRDRLGKEMEDLVEDIKEPIMFEEKEVARPTQLAWLPSAWQLGCSAQELRKVPLMKPIHEWQKVQNNMGNISRQEAVSMIPPLMLDVEGHHKVLDMCAAPGSKTAQLMEAVHRGKKEGELVPSGMVVANDIDHRRAYLLVHQCKRIGTANLLVVTHDGRMLPGADETYDRVLCDVPCSGDGTLRKNPDIWKRWAPFQALHLHPLQLRIALRGLQLLKVGGLMAYSTCSMNPVENEAVVSEIIRRCGGAVETVDCSEKYPELKRQEGVTSWRLFNKKTEVEYRTFEDLNENSRFKPFFPSMFAQEDCSTLGLQNCMRLYPHLQNTGGFFVTILRKVAPIPADALRSKHKEEEPEVKKPEGEEEEKKTETEKSEEPELKKAKTDEGAVEVKEASPVEVTTEETNTPTTAETPMETDTPVDTPKVEEKEDKKRNSNERQPRKKREERTNVTKYEPIDKDIADSIQKFYGLDTFPMEYLCRRGDTHKTITFSCQALCETVLFSDQVRKYKIVNTGARVFERNTPNQEYECDFRLSQEGLRLLMPCLTRRVVTVSMKDYFKIIHSNRKCIGLDGFEDETAEYLKASSAGTVVFIPNLEAEEGDSAETIAAKNNLKAQHNNASDIAVVVWRSAYTAMLMVKKDEVNEILVRLQAAGFPKGELKMENDRLAATPATSEEKPKEEEKVNAEEEK